MLLALDRLSGGARGGQGCAGRAGRLVQEPGIGELAAAIDARIAGDADRAIERYDAAVRACSDGWRPSARDWRICSRRRAYSARRGRIAPNPRHRSARSRRLYHRRPGGVTTGPCERGAGSAEPGAVAGHSAGPSVTKNRVLQALGIAYMQAGKARGAPSLKRRSRSRATSRDPIRQAATWAKSPIYSAQGDDAAAVAAYQQAMALHRSAGDLAGAATSLNNLGTLYLDRNRNHDAQKAFAEALTLYRDRGEGQGEATALSNLAAVQINLGELEVARTYAERSLDLREPAKGALRPCRDAGEPDGDRGRAGAVRPRGQVQPPRDSAARRRRRPLGNIIAWTIPRSLMADRGRLGPALQWSKLDATRRVRCPNADYWWGAVACRSRARADAGGRSADAAPLLAEALNTARGLK